MGDLARIPCAVVFSPFLPFFVVVPSCSFSIANELAKCCLCAAPSFTHTRRLFPEIYSPSRSTHSFVPGAAAPTLDVDWRTQTSFATCSTDKRIFVCKLGETEALKCLEGHTDEVNNIKWDPSGACISALQTLFGDESVTCSRMPFALWHVRWVVLLHRKCGLEDTSRDGKDQVRQPQGSLPDVHPPAAAALLLQGSYWRLVRMTTRHAFGICTATARCTCWEATRRRSTLSSGALLVRLPSWQLAQRDPA